MKIALSSYSLRQKVQSGEMTAFSMLAVCKQMGFAGIEYAGFTPHDASSPLEYAQKLREESQRLNLPIVNYAIGADFLNGSGGDLQAEIRRTMQQVDIAHALGAPLMRHDATAGFAQGTRGFRGVEDVLGRIAQGCKQVSEYAKGLGIRTMVENHGYFMQDSTRVEKLVNAVRDDNFGLLVDIGNFMCADEDPVPAVGRSAPYAFHVHAKDFLLKTPEAQPGAGFFPTRGGNLLRGTIVGHGIVPVRACLNALKSAGYDGYVAVEFEGLEEPLQAAQIALENLQQYLS